MKRITLAARLRKEIESSGLSRYEIHKKTGIDQATLSRFMSGKNLALDAVDKLLDFFELDVVNRKRDRS